jgi:hypothetical protein
MACREGRAVRLDRVLDVVPVAQRHEMISDGAWRDTQSLARSSVGSGGGVDLEHLELARRRATHLSAAASA